MGQKFKIEFLLFPKWLSIELKFGAKICEIGCSRDMIISLMTTNTSQQIGEMVILKCSKVWKSGQSIGIQ